MATERGRVSFIQGCDCREVTHAALDDPTHMLLQVALSELWALKKKKHMKLRGKIGRKEVWE